MEIKYRFKQLFKKALEIAEDADGVVNVTKDMQSDENVKSIHIRNDRVSSCSTITINGTHIFTSDNCISINIEGDVQTIDTQGSVTCHDVEGKISTQGSVTCGNVGKGISTQGSVRCGDVQGSINTMGSVNANNVKGDIDTMGRVTVNSRG